MTQMARPLILGMVQALALPWACAVADAATRLTLPLDRPVPIEPDSLLDRPFDLMDRGDGVYLYRLDSGQVMAVLPHLSLESTLAGLRGAPASDPATTAQLPPALRVWQGWPRVLDADPGGAPAAVDLNGDDRLELVLGLGDGQVLALDLDGNQVAGWPAQLDSEVRAGVELADLDLDGVPEILVSTRRGFAHALLARGNEELPGWPVCLDSGIPGEELWGAPSITRLPQGSVIVALAGTLGSLQVVTPAGRSLPGWPIRQRAGDPMWNPPGMYASPVLADLRGAGQIELVTATNAGTLLVHRLDARTASGWPRHLPDAARAGYGRVAVADLDRDGTAEILVATDRGFPGAPHLCAYSAEGEPVAGWPVTLPSPVNGGVAVADVDRSPGLEIAAASIGGMGLLHLYRADGRPVPGWPRSFEGLTFNLGPLLVDLDGRPGLEVVAVAGRSEYGAGCHLIALDAGGNLLPGFPLALGAHEAGIGGMLAGDLDQDGRTDLAIALGGRSELLLFHSAGDAAACDWPRSGFGPANPEILGTAGPLPNPDPRPPGFERAAIPPALADNLDPRRTISFLLRRRAAVALEVVDVRGSVIRGLLSTPLPEGLYAIAWDGLSDADRQAPSGVYYFQLRVDGTLETKQLLLLLR